jgi:hypothetical protein
MTLLRSAFRALLIALVAACGDSSDGGGTGGTGGVPLVEPGPTCTAFCVQVVGTCNAFAFSEEECRQGCQTDLNDEYAHAEACGEAAEDVFLCVSELDDCQAVYDWRYQDPRDDFPCRAEVLVVDGLIADGTCLP